MSCLLGKTGWSRSRKGLAPLQAACACRGVVMFGDEALAGLIHGVNSSRVVTRFKYRFRSKVPSTTTTSTRTTTTTSTRTTTSTSTGGRISRHAAVSWSRNYRMAAAKPRPTTLRKR